MIRWVLLLMLFLVPITSIFLPVEAQTIEPNYQLDCDSEITLYVHSDLWDDGPSQDFMCVIQNFDPYPIEFSINIAIEDLDIDHPTSILVNGQDVNYFIGEIDLDPKSSKELCFMLSDRLKNLFLILISKSDEKVFISCFISKNLIEEKELNASKIVRELSPLINGSGGGQPFYATGGGTNKNGIDQVISESKKIITQL